MMSHVVPMDGLRGDFTDSVPACDDVGCQNGATSGHCGNGHTRANAVQSRTVIVPIVSKEKLYGI